MSGLLQWNMVVVTEPSYLRVPVAQQEEDTSGDNGADNEEAELGGTEPDGLDIFEGALALDWGWFVAGSHILIRVVGRHC